MVKITSNDKSNIIEIDKENIFINSIINVDGNNNYIEILSCNHKIIDLKIKIRGDNNKIVISNSSKKIENLSITSIRGGNIDIYIDEEFGCEGCDINMNDGYEKLHIGKDCLFASGVKIRTSDGHAVIDLETDEVVNLPQDVVIGEHVWIGEDARILKGVNIPSHSIVGAYSVVTKFFDVKDMYTLIAGVPAKVMKRNIDWNRRRADEMNNNARILPFKPIAIVKDNKVTLQIKASDISNSWGTLVVLREVELKNTTVLKIHYTSDCDLDDYYFQIMFWGMKLGEHYWQAVEFAQSSRLITIDFSKLKKIGNITFDTVQNIEVRARKK